MPSPFSCNPLVEGLLKVAEYKTSLQEELYSKIEAILNKYSFIPYKDDLYTYVYSLTGFPGITWRDTRRHQERLLHSGFLPLDLPMINDLQEKKELNRLTILQWLESSIVGDYLKNPPSCFFSYAKKRRVFPHPKVFADVKQDTDEITTLFNKLIQLLAEYSFKCNTHRLENTLREIINEGKNLRYLGWLIPVPTPYVLRYQEALKSNLLFKANDIIAELVESTYMKGYLTLQRDDTILSKEDLVKLGILTNADISVPTMSYGRQNFRYDLFSTAIYFDIIGQNQMLPVLNPNLIYQG